MEKPFTDKDEIIRQLSKQVRIDGLTDITGWINENCAPEVNHSGFVRSVAYRMEKLGIVEVIPVQDFQRFYVKELRWDKKHPYLHALKVGASTALFSLIVGILVGLSLSQLGRKEQAQTTEKKQPISNMAHDSATILRGRSPTFQNGLKDSE